MGINRTSFGLKRIGFGCTVNQLVGAAATARISGATASPVGGNDYIATWVSNGNRSSSTPHGTFTWTAESALPATTTNPSTLVMTNNGRRSSIIDNNLIRTVINAGAVGSASIRIVMSGGGAGAGNPRGNGNGGMGGGGGHVAKDVLSLPGNGSYNIYVGAGGGGGGCNNQSGQSGTATVAFGGRAGSGGGGTSEHNNNCNGCGFDPGSSLTGSNSSSSGSPGGCSFGSGAGAPSHTSDITGSNVSYGNGNSAVGGGGGSGGRPAGWRRPGQGGVVVVRWDNAVINIV